MASADFCRPAPPPRGDGSLKQADRPPRVMRTPLPAYPRRIYARALLRQISDFEDTCLLLRRVRLVCDSCSSGPRFAIGFLQTPPRGGSPCRSADTSLCRACRGLPPPSECALPGARKEPAALLGDGFHSNRMWVVNYPLPAPDKGTVTAYRATDVVAVAVLSARHRKRGRLTFSLRKQTAMSNLYSIQPNASIGKPGNRPSWSR